MPTLPGTIRVKIIERLLFCALAFGVGILIVHIADRLGWLALGDPLSASSFVVGIGLSWLLLTFSSAWSESIRFVNHTRSEHSRGENHQPKPPMTDRDAS